MDGSLQILRLAPAGGGDGSGVGGSTFTRLGPLPRSSGGGGGDAVSTQASDVVHAVAAFRDHAKYVVCARWSRDGALLATASHDKTVALYSTAAAAADGDGAAAAAAPLRLVTKLYFPEAVEAVEFVGGGASGDPQRLMVASREQPHLVYVDLVDGAGYAQARVSVNANAWDAHVSFSVLGLAASPDGRYVLAATDRARTIVYRAGHNAHIRTLVGHAADAYFQPRAAWSPSGLTAFCNSQDARGVVAYCVAGARVVERAGGHAGAVRDVCTHPTARVLYTASYDKSVKVWTY
ncbi:WD40-repeat-containing domain protein [Tribonema minus]|uniref:WD40-repeat-containing domain protein n=1 Tax=Tribonema minus TaxID=303371 RepID=A0A836CE45_9STRA|nr:WD40-repeat-containing domain protein [Tribonema minus]